MFLKIKFVTLYARGIMNGSCFYQFVQYTSTEEMLVMSYTVNRQHIRIATFNLNKYLTEQ